MQQRHRPNLSFLLRTCSLSVYASGLAGSLLISATPLPFRASAALAWCAFAIATVSVMDLLPGLEWLAPAFLLKLVGSHAVPAPNTRSA